MAQLTAVRRFPNFLRALFCTRSRPVRRGRRAGFRISRFLLTRAVLDRLLNLLLYRFKIERSRSLHRRKLDRGLREIPDVLLDNDEAPELAGEEVVAIAE